MATNPQGLIKEYEKSFGAATAANEKRYSQGLGLLDEAIKRYQPGGGFGAGALAQYEVGKTQAISGGMQNLVSSGLANTTIAAGLPMKYEQEVGTPFRLQLEDLRMQNLTEAERAKAGFIQQREDQYPDMNAMAGLLQQGASGGGGTTMSSWSQPFGSGLSSFLDRARSKGSGVSTPKTNPGMTMGSQSSWDIGRPGSMSMGGYSPAATESMDEDEYQSLLKENLQRNEKAKTSMSSSKPSYDEMLKWTLDDWVKIYKQRGVLGDPNKMREVQMEMGFLGGGKKSQSAGLQHYWPEG